jgi:hypothetical protein
VLFLDVDSKKVCSKRPNGVQENACFVIDRSQLKHPEDWLITRETFHPDCTIHKKSNFRKSENSQGPIQYI